MGQQTSTYPPHYLYLTIDLETRYRRHHLPKSFILAGWNVFKSCSSSVVDPFSLQGHQGSPSSCQYSTSVEFAKSQFFCMYTSSFLLLALAVDYLFFVGPQRLFWGHAYSMLEYSSEFQMRFQEFYNKLFSNNSKVAPI